MRFAVALLFVLALPVLLSCAYLLLLTLLSGSLATPPRSSRSIPFDVIVPAHDEAQVIARTVRSLRAVDWPADAFRIIVIADNCTDDTAAIARAAGAIVLERNDTSLRGKGYALAFAFDASAREGRARAVVVVDADTEVSANLLEACASRIEGGATAVQVRYGVLNPRASWRTELMTIAMTAFHDVRSRGRERLGASCGIRGNGWCLTMEQLRTVPYRAFSLAEDLEYGIALGLAGCRVAYADEAHVDGEMVTSVQASESQRQRWEGGRFALIGSHTGILLGAAVRARSAVCLHLAIDLLILPLSWVGLQVLLLLLAASLLALADPAARFLAVCALACAAILVAHVLRGLQLSGLGWGGLRTLARVPGYVAWKTVLVLRRKPKEWIRTDRERP
jgi:cellulose synthase/poly-beta-1,6-N-acetylglucosamine synthase-like glycosyltransferase